jgi:hypothetical protein
VKTTWLVLLLLFGIAIGSRAQISVVAELEDSDFLLGEHILIRVRVANTSGQRILLGDTKDWLTFTVESRDGYLVQKLQDAAVYGPFTLENSEGAIKRVDLSPCFAISQSGRYQVTAHLKVDQWGGRTWTSAPVPFSVVGGATLSHLDFGVPREGDAPEIRRYSLLKSVQPRKVKLYFRLSDAVGSQVFATYQIGSLMSFSEPESLLDRANNFHVLYQTGARSFLYFSADTEGQMRLRQLYEIGTMRPKLVSNEKGDVIVIGGVRRPTREDYPPPPPDEPLPTPPLPALPGPKAPMSAPTTNAPSVAPSTP